MELESPKTWVSGLVALLAGLFAWQAKRQIDHYDLRFEDHSRRLQNLESQVATREDVQRVNDRLTEMSDTMHEQHAEILKALADR